jgi:hypothetical protein
VFVDTHTAEIDCHLLALAIAIPPAHQSIASPAARAYLFGQGLSSCCDSSRIAITDGYSCCVGDEVNGRTLHARLLQQDVLDCC